MSVKPKLTLTIDQEKIIKGICEDIEKPNARIVLCGYAGTGKTVTTAALVSKLRQEELQVVVATPTHKARAQVEKALIKQGAADFTCVTVHRLLGLKQVRNYKTGEESFEIDPTGKNMLKDGLYENRKHKLESESWQEFLERTKKEINVVIVDETSMLQQELYEYLIKEAGQRPIIFVGDDRQLLPVKEDKVCAAFLECESKYQLTKVLRHDGAILNLATKTRQIPIGRARFDSAIGGGSQVLAYNSRSQWIEKLLDKMKSDQAMSDPDYCRVLAWTNKIVRELNDRIHIERYKEDAPRYLASMTCVSVDAIPDPYGKRPLFNSTVDLYIHEAETEMFKAPHDLATDELWPTWLLTVSGDGNCKPVQIRVLDREEERRWQFKQKEFAEAAKACDKFQDEKRRKLWCQYFERKDQFGKLEPASALTVHKSQGSTFDNVFLHWSIDGFGSAPTLQQNQLAYVGITRASQGLHVVADWG